MSIMDINNNSIIVLSSLLLLLFTVGCKGDEGEPGISYIEWNNHEMRAEQLVTALLNGDFTVVTDGFEEDLKRSLGLGGLKSSWRGMLRIAGDFVSIGETVFILLDEDDYQYEIYHVVTIHENKEINTRIVFNLDGSIAGLWFIFVDER